MRSRLLFTAALFCVEMTPFGRLYTVARADDASVAPYSDYTSQPYVGGGDTVQLGTKTLIIQGDGTPQTFSGSLQEAEGSSNSLTGNEPFVGQHGGIDLNSGGPVNNTQETRANQLTLTGQSTYGGYTFVRGNGELVLTGTSSASGGITSTGEVEVGLAANDTAKMVVDKNGYLSLTENEVSGVPKGTSKALSLRSGWLVVGNGDESYGAAPTAQQVTRLAWNKREYATVPVKQENNFIVQNGGQVTASRVVAGNYENGLGRITVTGSDSQKNTASQMNVGNGGIHIGRDGEGSLSVTQGGKVTTTGGLGIGENSGSKGIVTVAGQGATLNVSGSAVNPDDAAGAAELNGQSLSVGYNGQGRLNVEDGGTVTADNATIGSQGTLYVNESGTVVVGASGSQATNLTMAGAGATYSVRATDQAVGSTTVGGNAVYYERDAGRVDPLPRLFKARNYTLLQSGAVHVNGSASLGSGTIDVQKSDSSRVYAGQGYRILGATGSVSMNGDNRLTGSLTKMPYLAPYLVVENNLTNATDAQGAIQSALDVLMQRNNTAFSAPASTRNQRAVGAALDGLPTNSDLAQAMTSMNSADEARHSMDNLSGVIHASARSALIQDSYLLEEAVLSRLDGANCDGVSGISGTGQYDMATGRKGGPCYRDHAVMWGQAYGSMGHNAGDGNAGLLHHRTAGFVVGVDAPVDDRWRVGGMFSYGNSMFNMGGAADSSGNSNNVSLGAYAGRNWGKLNIRLGGFYSWNVMNMRRQVEVGDFGGRQTSHYLGGTARIFSELGYKMRFKKTQFEPFAGLSYVNQNVGHFQEHGAAALTGHAQDTGVFFSSFGFRAAREFMIAKTRLLAHVMGAYRHAFGGIVSSREENLAQSDQDMNIAGVPLSRDSAVIKTGLTAKLSDQVDVDLSYIGQYGGQSVESGATGSVHVRF